MATQVYIWSQICVYTQFTLESGNPRVGMVTNMCMYTIYVGDWQPKCRYSHRYVYTHNLYVYTHNLRWIKATPMCGHKYVYIHTLRWRMANHVSTIEGVTLLASLRTLSTHPFPGAGSISLTTPVHTRTNVCCHMMERTYNVYCHMMERTYISYISDCVLAPYGVASISRRFKITGHFRKRAL